MTTEFKPQLATNYEGDTVSDALNSFISHAATTFVGGARLDIATAYFNIGGYALLADSLAETSGVRLLLGAEPTQPENRPRALAGESVIPERAARTRLEKSLEGHERSLETDRDLLGFTREADHSARRLVAWLRSGAVKVKRLENRFLHGKAFLVSDHAHGVVAGSSNFTHAGLTTNLELNLGNYSPHVIEQVSRWFNHLWDEADEYDLASLFEARFKPHSPQLIYLRMLWERYGRELEQEAEATGLTQIHLTGFQSDGLWRAQRILNRLNGVLIADEVGLGKTYLAGELIREASIDRRQRVLVVAPATLRDGPWRAFQSKHNLPMELRSFEDLVAGNLDAETNDYAMVVVDESHNLRNPGTQRADAMRRLLAGSPPKQLVLLTATPVNNSLWDLYYQLGFFLHNDAVFADVGIRSLRDHFAKAMALNPDDLTPEHLFDVLDTVAVRRTRSFVKRFYRNDTIWKDGKEITVTFPTTRVRKVTYDIDAELPGFFDKFGHALDPPEDSHPDDSDVLTLARYIPSKYRRDGDADAYELQLAGLLRSGLLKRFESSPHAFAATCQKMVNGHDAFLSLLERGGKVATGAALADWIATDSDDLDEIDAYVDTHTDITDDAALYHKAKLAMHVRKDRDLLEAFGAKARTVTPQRDPNLAELVNQLATISRHAEKEGIGPNDIRDRRKVLIFSYFTDTVNWIFEHLRNTVNTDPRLFPYRDRMAKLSGDQSATQKAAVLWGFAPDTTEPPSGKKQDLYDIVVTTDVLAEGVNLQQARHVFNYDLPWNPMRLVQRHGRIDRIGSHHSEVFVHCVFPDSRLDEMLGLEDRLNKKIKQAAVTVGVPEILPGQTAAPTCMDFTDDKHEIEKLRRQDSHIFEEGGTSRGVLSGEEYRQELRKALEDHQHAELIKKLPWGSGSGMAARWGDQSGFVFCARVGDWHQPLFRYVNKRSEISDETLACLERARPARGFETDRTLNAAIHSQAFDYWEKVRADIVTKWNYLADKAHLEPRIPPALERAAGIVRSNPPDGLTQEDIDRTVDTLNAPYPERIVRGFRRILKTSTDPQQQAMNIIEEVRSLGLEPYIPPEPLPEITPDDVHLVCWLALT